MTHLSAGARVALLLGAKEAQSLGAAEIDREHVFIGLCRAETIAHLQPQESDLSSEEQLRARLEGSELLRAYTECGFDFTRARRRVRELWGQKHPSPAAFTGHRSAQCRAVFAVADSHAPAGVTCAGLFHALLETPGLVIEEVLGELKVSRHDLAAALGRVASEPMAAPEAATPWTRDLTQLARDGRLQPAIGRDQEFKQMARTLLQSGKNSPILVGDAGVGKTAIVEGLAVRLATGRVPEPLGALKIVEVSLGAMVAGAKFRGEFEERIQQLIKAAEAERNLVLFIDEIHMLLGAGAGGGAMDAANLLKPALARGILRCIGAATTADYQRYIEHDAALTRRFQVVWVEEPTRAQAVEILSSLRPGLEKHYEVGIQTDAIEAAVDLSIRYLPDRHLPDKAIDVLNQACSRAVFSTFSPSLDGATPVAVGRSHVAEAIAERCRVPLEHLTRDESRQLLQLEATLRARVIGQDHAVDAVANVLRTSRTGLRNPRRPVGVFLLTGPTGTGKTELARAVAEALFGDEERLIRLDMSEFSERHQVARLIGSPPGYIGHEHGGQLTDAVRARPYSVVVFDEVDKAHADVHNLFLQILDEGTLTDGHGRAASFREAVVFMTANYTAANGGNAIGFKAAAADTPSGSHDAAAGLFRPEIVNRLDRVIAFNPLGIEAIRQIVDKIVRRANTSLAAQRITIELSPAACALVAEQGYSAEFGARALERAFNTLVEQPVGRLILEAQLTPGSRVSVRVDDSGGRLVFAPDLRL